MSDLLKRDCGPGAVPGAISYLEGEGVAMHSLLADCGGTLVLEAYWDPWKRDDVHRIYSCTKSFVALAVGCLLTDGLLDLDDRIVSFFPQYITQPVHPWLRDLTVRDMLMMRTCHRMTTYKIGADGRYIPSWRSDWVRSFFDTPPDHEPGSVFIYDTSATHVLASLVENLSGTDFLSYLRLKFLDRLGVSADTCMLHDPEGRPCGGSGLMMRPVDLLKVIAALGRGGLDDVISSDYLRAATSPLSLTLRGHDGRETGYGFFFWTDDDGTFAMMGLGGQYALYDPVHDLAFVTTADTQASRTGDLAIRKALAMIAADCPRSPVRLPALTLHSLRGEGRCLVKDGVYEFAGPLWKRLELSSDDEGGRICITLDGAVYEIPFAFSRNVLSDFPADLSGPAASSAAVLPDGSLLILVQLLGRELGSIRMHLCPGHGSVTVVSGQAGEVSFRGFDFTGTGIAAD